MFFKPEHKPRGEVVHRETHKERIVQGILDWEADLSPKDGGNILKSKVYRTKDMYDSRWQIELDTNFVEKCPEGDHRFLSVWVNLLSSAKEEMNVNLYIHVMDTNQPTVVPVYSKGSTMIELSPTCRKIGYDKYIPMYKLGDLSQKISFKVVIQVFMPFEPEETKKENESSQVKREEQSVSVPPDEVAIIQGSYLIGDGPPNLDRVILFGHKPINVDSLRLSICSPVFKSYFEGDNNQTPDLSEVIDSESILNVILKFCQTGKVSVQLKKSKSGVIMRIIKAAHDLKITELQEKVEPIFLDHLTLKTFIDAVELTKAGIIDFDRAAPKFRDFITKNFDKLKKDEGYRKSYKEDEEFYAQIMFYETFQRMKLLGMSSPDEDEDMKSVSNSSDLTVIDDDDDEMNMDQFRVDDDDDERDPSSNGSGSNSSAD